MVANRSACPPRNPVRHRPAPARNRRSRRCAQRRFGRTTAARPYRGAVRAGLADIAAAKDRLRGRLLAARRTRDAPARRAARRANGEHLRAALRDVACIAAYLPLPTEPLDPALLDELAATHRVLVPVVTGAAPLNWCDYPTQLRPGPLGIAEPSGPRLGPEAITGADVVLIPALAVDAQGHRLGRGGGHYDRTLALRAELAGTTSAPLLLAVLYDEELLPAVPFDALDQRVSALVRPSSGVLRLG